MKLFRPSKNEAQKAKIIFAGVVVSFMLTSYQNCGKVNPSSHALPPGTQEQKPALLPLNESNSLTLIGDYTHPEFGAYAYKVNVDSGEVSRYMYEVPENDPQNVPVKLCLSEAKRAALQAEFDKANVCLFKKSANPQQVCTMIYTAPYAIIKDASNNSYKLGENASACFDFYDICSESRASFIAAAQSALSGLDSSYCN